LYEGFIIKKISFIEPGAPNLHVYSKFKFPRLGTIILGTILKKLGYEVKVFIEDMSGLDENFINDSDLICISTITSTAPRSYKLAAEYKRKNIPVLMGGPHVTFNHIEALGYCDYVLRGEADNTIIDFMSAFENNEGFEKIPGIAYYVDNNLIENNTFSHPEDLDKIPIPDFGIVHGFYNDKQLSLAPVITSRGCPNNCSFCNVPQMFGRKIRFRSAENVIEELKGIKNKWVFFYDDNFTANVTRTKKLLSLMRDNNIKKKWMTQVTITAAKDEELLKEMHLSGCDSVCIGFESINQDVLKAYNKRQSSLEMHEYIKRFHKAKIDIHGMFIFGSDSESHKDMKATVKFSKKMNLQSVQYLILTPLPGTAFFKRLLDSGRILYKDWQLYDGHHAVFLPKNISTLKLQKETMKMMSRFYSWWRIFRRTINLKITDALLNYRGKSLIRKWNKNKFNRSFIKKLKLENKSITPPLKPYELDKVKQKTL